jgi:hypothetical protein
MLICFALELELEHVIIQSNQLCATVLKCNFLIITRLLKVIQDNGSRRFVTCSDNLEVLELNNSGTLVPWIVIGVPRFQKRNRLGISIQSYGIILGQVVFFFVFNKCNYWNQTVIVNI